MKNLKINSQKIKALIGSMILVTNLSACSIVKNDTSVNSTKATEATREIEYLLIDTKLVPVSNISLMDSNKNIITKIDWVIIDNEIKKKPETKEMSTEEKEIFDYDWLNDPDNDLK